MSARRAAVAVLVGLAALGVYLQTLYPGLGGGGDAAKFQYLGSVLGTAHPPGYPLYILISYVFSQLPIGSLAYRMNLMSACFGVSTILLAFFILVRLRCHVLVAAAAALALAFDRYFWGRTLGAEVYSLNAALVALVVWLALRWTETGRDRDLYLTAAVFGLSLGNHLTAATIAPGLAAYVAIARPQTVRVRTAGICLLLVLAGLSQYGFIILRTIQGSPHAEARATNVIELVDVVRASKYSEGLFAFTWPQLVHERLPTLWRLFQRDLGPAGLAFFALGSVAAIVQRRRAAFLFAAVLAGIAGLTLNVDADVEGFLAPAFVMAWLMAGLGMQTAWATAVRGSGIVGRAGFAASTVVLLAVPVWQLARNYRANDHHGRTYETRYFNALFDRLDARAAFVQEAYSVDQLIRYKLFGEHAAKGRDISLIPVDVLTVQQYARDGFAVYAFDNGREALEGLGFQFDPVELHEAGSGPDAVDTMIDTTPLPLFRLARWMPCANIGNQGWRDLGETSATGTIVLRIDNYRPFDSRVLIYATGTSGRLPALIMSQGSGAPQMALTTFRRSASAEIAALDAALRRDAVEPGRFINEPLVHRLELRVNDAGQFSQSLLVLGDSRPAAALINATVDRDNARRALVCEWSARPLLAKASVDNLLLGPQANALFGQGWLPSQRDSGEDSRGMHGPSAEIAVPLQRAGPIRFRMRARPPEDDVERRIAISVNSQTFPSRLMPYGWDAYEWIVDAGVFVPGLNRLTVDVVARGPGGASANVTAAGGLSAAVSELSFEILEGQRAEGKGQR